MTFSAAVGTFPERTDADGDLAVTGVGFQPKLLILMGNSQYSDGDNTDKSNMTMGAGTGTGDTDSSRGAVGLIDASTQGYWMGGAGKSTAHTPKRPIWGTIESPIQQLPADLTSLDSDGFTLYWENVSFLSARYQHYLALAGTDLTNQKVGNFSLATSTGNQAITGLGFQPSGIILFSPHAAVNADTTLSALSTRGHNFLIGFADSAGNQGFTYLQEKASANSCKYQRTDKIWTCLNGTTQTTTTVTSEASFVSMDSDGFTINLSTASATASVIYYIAFKGIQCKVGSFNQPGSTGNQAITGTGFQTGAVALMSCAAVSSSSVSTTNPVRSFGWGSSSSRRASVWNGSNGTNFKSGMDQAKIIKMATLGSTPTIDAAADLSSLDSNGFTLNWSTVDATAREIIYMAFGAAASASSVVSKSTFTRQAVNRASTY